MEENHTVIKHLIDRRSELIYEINVDISESNKFLNAYNKTDDDELSKILGRQSVNCLKKAEDKFTILSDLQKNIESSASIDMYENTEIIKLIYGKYNSEMFAYPELFKKANWVICQFLISTFFSMILSGTILLSQKDNLFSLLMEIAVILLNIAYYKFSAMKGLLNIYFYSKLKNVLSRRHGLSN